MALITPWQYQVENNTKERHAISVSASVICASGTSVIPAPISTSAVVAKNRITRNPERIANSVAMLLLKFKWRGLAPPPLGLLIAFALFFASAGRALDVSSSPVINVSSNYSVKVATVGCADKVLVALE